MEHRVNQYLEDRKDWQPTMDEFKQAQLALVTALKTKDTKINQEAQRNWTQISNSISNGCEPDFNINDSKLRAIKTITLESVVEVWQKIVSHEFGRLNIKISSKAKAATDRSKSQNLNEQYYSSYNVVTTFDK